MADETVKPMDEDAGQSHKVEDADRSLDVVQIEAPLAPSAIVQRAAAEALDQRAPRRGRRRLPTKRSGSSGFNTDTAGQHRGKKRSSEQGKYTRPNKKLSPAVSNEQVARIPTAAAPPSRVAPRAASATPKQAMLAFLLRRKAKNMLTPAQAAALKHCEVESGPSCPQLKKQKLG